MREAPMGQAKMARGRTFSVLFSKCGDGVADVMGWWRLGLGSDQMLVLPVL